MDIFEVKKFWDLHGLISNLDLPAPILPIYPPGSNPPTFGVMNQKRLKGRFFHDNASVNTKLEDFTKNYQKFAIGLFETAHPPVPPGHPLFSRLDATSALQSENDKLRKENSELKKQLEKNQKSNSKI